MLHEAMTAPLKQKLTAIEVLNKLGVLNLHKIILESDTGDEGEESFFSEEDRRLLALITREQEL
jgi:hypothetical protein